MKNKILNTIAVVIAVLSIGFALHSTKTEAYANRCATGGKNNVSHSACSYNVTVGPNTYAVSLDIYHCTTHYGNGTACNVAISESTAHLSPSTLSGNWAQACGNGWGSYNARITSVRPPTPPGGQPGTGGGTTFTGTTRTGSTSTNTSSSTQTILKRSCTPGVDCPPEDLGNILTKLSLGSAYISSQTKTCSLFWNVGTENKDNTIDCKLISGSSITSIPKDPLSTYPKGYPVAPGQQTVACFRGSSTNITKLQTEHPDSATMLSTAKDYHVDLQTGSVNCVKNPSIREI